MFLDCKVEWVNAKRSAALIETAVALGYGGVAFNETFDLSISTKMRSASSGGSSHSSLLPSSSICPISIISRKPNRNLPPHSSSFSVSEEQMLISPTWRRRQRCGREKAFRRFETPNWQNQPQTSWISLQDGESSDNMNADAGGGGAAAILPPSSSFSVEKQWDDILFSPRQFSAKLFPGTPRTNILRNNSSNNSDNSNNNSSNSNSSSNNSGNNNNSNSGDSNNSINSSNISWKDLSFRSGVGNQFLQLRRATLIIDHPNCLSAFNNFSRNRSEYDIIAVQPLEERSWQIACSSCECDIISLDISRSRLPFQLRRSHVGVAISRGIFFEVDLSLALRDDTCRRTLLQNLPSLLRFVPLEKLILSSGASDPIEFRGPHDIANLAAVIGVANSAEAKKCLSNSPLACVYRGAARRTCGGCVVSQKNGGGKNS